MAELAFRDGIMDRIRLREPRFDERAFEAADFLGDAGLRESMSCDRVMDFAQNKDFAAANACRSCRG